MFLCLNHGEKIFPPSLPPLSHPFHTLKYHHTHSRTICTILWFDNCQLHAQYAIICTQGDLNLKFKSRQEVKMPAKALFIASEFTNKLIMMQTIAAVMP